MRIAAVVLFVLLLTAVAWAQTPQTPPPAGRGAGPAGAQTPAPAPEPLAPQGYTYNPEGRRDPFVSLVRRGADLTTAPGERPPGLAGMTSAEIALTGTIEVKATGGWMAMVLGTDKKTYLLRAGDRLLDGTVREVTKDSMVILQRVNDPLSLETTREVRKVLRQTEEAK